MVFVLHDEATVLGVLVSAFAVVDCHAREDGERGLFWLKRWSAWSAPRQT